MKEQMKFEARPDDVAGGKGINPNNVESRPGDLLRSDIIKSAGRIETLSSLEQTELCKIQKEYLKKISDAVYQNMLVSGVTNIQNENFWDTFINAENDILQAEQDRKIDTVTFKEGGVEVDSRPFSSIEEVYASYGDLLVYKAESAPPGANFTPLPSNLEPFCYDTGYRFSGVIRNFVFDFLIQKNLVNEGDRELFLNLFTITSYNSRYKKLPVDTKAFMAGEKKKNLDEFNEKYKEKMHEILVSIKDYSQLLYYMYKLPSEISEYGGYEKALASEGRGNWHAKELNEYPLKSFSIKEVVMVAQNSGKAFEKYKLWNQIGHKLAHTLHFVSDIETM